MYSSSHPTRLRSARTVGPTVIVRNRHTSVRRGDRITLRCEAHGDQPLDVTWRTRGTLIDPAYDIRYHLQNTPLARGLASELTVVQSTLADRGEYSCVAANAYGHDHAALHLQVQEPPSFPKSLHVTELGSRSVVLAWLAPHEMMGGQQQQQPSMMTGGTVASSNGDGGGGGQHQMAPAQPISNYVLQFKDAQVCTVTSATISTIRTLLNIMIIS